jgi:hypothetical protein
MSLSEAADQARERRREIVVHDAEIDPDRLMLEGVEARTVPAMFNLGEVTRFFFGKSTSWLRNIEKEGGLIFEGRVMFLRRDEHNVRVASLADIERIAHALCQTHRITPDDLLVTLRLVKAQAQLHRYPL